MKNYVCWKPEDVYQVINPDADAVPSHVFRAVHTDLTVRKRDQLDSDGSLVRPEEVLKALLAPRDHALVPVIGGSGTGKSHLIRWLQLRLPESSVRDVLFVPKAGTNLRGIVAALIAKLPSEARDPYLAMLKGAGSTVLNPQAQRSAVLSHLHVALVNDPGAAASATEREKEEFLLDGLRSVFLDPHLRDQHFLRDGGFASEIAAHVFERPDKYRPAEQRREFTRRDLPLNVASIAKAARSTQDFLPALVNDQSLADSAVQLVNRNLDWAISNCLNITGDRLIELMLEIRRHLKAQGKELILLIEDFARLQGLDRALLQSMLEQRTDLCRLRTAFATTTGFFDSIAPTVRTRLTFVVDLDVPLGGNGGIPLSKAVSRYLNALRWGPSQLHEQWTHVESGDREFEMESYCGTCDFKEKCHRTFGQVDGMGLYPFTENALSIMAERADPESHSRFNLRTFQRRVLRPVTLAGSDIQSDQFPQFNLLTDLGGARNFPPTEEQKLKQRDPGGWKRRLTLLQLWADGHSASDLDEDFLGAFGLKQLGLGKASPPPTIVEPTTPREGTRPPDIDARDNRLIELEAWHRGQDKLPARTSQDLRELVFDALRGYIDWDNVGLAPASMLGTGKPFQPRSIYFTNQVTNKAASTVSLTIPLKWEDETERYQTVLALQGLLQLKSEGSWAFKDGAEKCAALHSRLLAWSGQLVTELRALDASGGEWNPASSSFELLALTTVLTKSECHLRSKVDVLKLGFSEPGSVPQFANERLAKLVADLLAQREALTKILASRSGTMKGGSATTQIVDGSALLEVAGALRQRGLMPNECLPADSDIKLDELKQLAKLARRVSTEAPSLLREEIELRMQWAQEMEASFGNEATKMTIINAASTLLDALGPYAIRGSQEVVSARNSFADCDYDRALKSTRDLVADKVALTDMARDVAEPIRRSRLLTEAMKTAIDAGERELRARLKTEGVDPDHREQLRKSIESDLELVVDALEGVANVNSN